MVASQSESTSAPTRSFVGGMGELNGTARQLNNYLFNGVVDVFNAGSARVNHRMSPTPANNRPGPGSP